MLRRIKKRNKIIKKVVCILLCICMLWTGCFGVATPLGDVHAENQEPQNLFAQSAVLMDAESGRVLFSKNGDTERAMASTTKIMTCILALEYGKLDQKITVSENAAAQPKVHLGVNPGDTFLLRDLLYSLMLESHNDSAVIIAEGIGKSVEGFADMMNSKAKELGCNSTYFITPNGLDAVDDKGIHRTTAEELALIMKYCIMDSPQKDMFLEITRTQTYQFSECSGKRTYQCTNHNAFLQMMEGALSGKTGFTGDAGYCYIGALRKGERTFIVALLACGWPNNRNYKWTDTKALMNYALENYEYRSVYQEVDGGVVSIQNAMDKKSPFLSDIELPLTIVGNDKDFRMLLRKDEQIEVDVKKIDVLEAPVQYGEKVGEVTYRLDGNTIKSCDIITTRDIQEKTFKRYFNMIFRIYMLKNINKND